MIIKRKYEAIIENIWEARRKSSEQISCHFESRLAMMACKSLSSLSPRVGDDGQLCKWNCDLYWCKKCVRLTSFRLLAFAVFPAKCLWGERTTSYNSIGILVSSAVACLC